MFYPDLPLYTEVSKGLWIGGTADDDTIMEFNRAAKPSITKQNFDTVITAYAWANPADWGVKEIRYCFYDSDMSDVDIKQLEEVVEIAYKDWVSGRRVIFRCQLGANRSGLLVAKCLMKHGYTAQEAIELIRSKRGPIALSNPDFVRYLEGLPIHGLLHDNTNPL